MYTIKCAKNAMLPLLNCNIGALAGKRSRTQDLVDEAEAASAAFARHGRNDELDDAMSLLNGATRTANALAAAIDALDAHATRVLIALRRDIAETTRAAREYLRDQARGNVVVFDLETTRLIESGVPIGGMKVSVACATVLYYQNLTDPELAMATASSFTFWHEDADGAPVSLLMDLLRSAALIVAYNGKAFDLVALRKHMRDTTELHELQRKCLDPFAILRDATTTEPANYGATYIGDVVAWPRRPRACRSRRC